MQRVVEIGIVVVGHIEPRSLTLHDVAQIVNQPLTQHVVVHVVEGRHYAVEQEHADHRQQIGHHSLRLAGAADADFHTVHKQLEDIEVHQRQHTLQEHVQRLPAERPRVAPPYQHQCLPQFLHSITIFFITLPFSSSFIRWRKVSRRQVISCLNAAAAKRSLNVPSR